MYCLILFNRKKGNIANALTSESEAMLELWALQNTKPHQDCIICDQHSGELTAYIVGDKSGFPRKEADAEGTFVDNYCEGLFEAIQEM